MKEKKTCPCCGHKVIVWDARKKEVYCNHCGLILDDNSYVEEKHTFETSHEPLDSGLRINSKMAEIEKSYGFKSQSKKWYENLKQNYFEKLETELLDLGFDFSEAKDIFNYCFLDFYRLDIENNKPIVLPDGKKKQRTRKKVVNEFLDSKRFEAFDVSACVSRLKIPKQLRSSWLP